MVWKFSVALSGILLDLYYLRKEKKKFVFWILKKVFVDQMGERNRMLQ